LKNKTIPSWAVYPILIVGFLTNILLMATQADPFFRYTNLLLALTIMVIGFFLNQKNILGGGDILLFVGIILMTPAKLMFPEFYLGFFFLSCLCGVAYYVVMRLVKKEYANYIKFVPCILIGYIVTLVAFL